MIFKLRNLYTVRYLTVLILLVGPVGCKVGAPKKIKNDLVLPNKFIAEDSSATSIAQTGYKVFFTDTNLVTLIDRALQNNLDLKMAVQRIEMSRSNRLAASGFLMPRLELYGSAGGTKYGKYTVDGVGNYDTNFSPNIDEDQKIPDPIVPDYFLGFQSSWELDIWRKLRSQKKSAYLNFLASERGRDAVITALISEIAMLYFELLEYDYELEVITNNIALQQRALEMIEIQKTAGRVTELAVNQFDAQLSNTKSVQFAVEQMVVNTEIRLNLLLGDFPKSIPRTTPLLEQKFPEIVNVGVPSEMMLQRPDIKQAELELAAAEADVYAARAAFYPSLTITSYAGFNGFDATLLFDSPGSLAYRAIAGLSAPIFNRRNIKANYRRTRAQNIALLYNYQKTIITAYGEVLTGLKGIENYTKVLDNRTQQVELLQRAVATSNDLFVNGFATYLEVVTAQKSVFEAELGQAEASRERFNYLIQLYRALGGGVEKRIDPKRKK